MHRIGQRTRTGTTRMALSALAFGAAVALTVPTAFAVPADTEDILYMLDGRELHGQIIEETRTEVVFEIKVSGITSVVTYQKTEIDRIEHDIALAEEEEAGEEKSRGGSGTTTGPDDDASNRTFGARRGDVDDESLPGFYVVPMMGQMGTDANTEFYESIVDDIRAKDPDYLVIKIESEDLGEGLYPDFDPEEVSLTGSPFLDMFRDLMNMFHDDLGDIPQVAWVQTSVGISTLLALSWDELYMRSDARFGGLRTAAGNFEGVRADANMYGKFREAYMGWLRGLMMNSSRDEKLVDAMVVNEALLAATWKGREVEWSLDGAGEYLIDGSKDATVSFNARTAENFCLSKGTADDLDDLALLLGIREYRVLESAAESDFDEYRTDWRATYDGALKDWDDHVEARDDASLDPPQRLGKAKRLLESIIRAINKFDAVETRLAMKGITKTRLEIMIETIEDQLRALRRNNRGNRGGAGRRPPGGSGLGGG